MFYNIGYANAIVIYCHFTVITKVMLLNYTERQYDHGMAENYCNKRFDNIGPWGQCYKSFFARDLRILVLR